MKRTHGTNRSGVSFDFSTRLAVWCKGTPIPGYRPSEFRRDRYGAVMAWSHYGRTSSNYGWEIDHVIPVVRFGGDNLANLQPLQWQNNRRKGDGFGFLI